MIDMTPSDNLEKRMRQIILREKKLTVGELISEAYRLVLDAGQKDEPIVFLNQLLDEAGKKILKTAAARKLIELGDGDGFKTGYATVEFRTTETFEAAIFVPRSFLESLAAWD